MRAPEGEAKERDKEEEEEEEERDEDEEEEEEVLQCGHDHGIKRNSVEKICRATQIGATPDRS